MAMEAAVTFLNLLGDQTEPSVQPLRGLTVAVQGCGNVGRPLIHFLLEKGVSKVIAAEASEGNFEKARQEFESFGDRVDVRLCAFGDRSILTEKVDIVSPNAWGGVLDKDICAGIQAKIVCGCCEFTATGRHRS